MADRNTKRSNHELLASPGDSVAIFAQGFLSNRSSHNDPNPFGFSSTNLGSLYKGLVRDTSLNFKHLRKTRHTHHPVDDARGNAEALLAMSDGMGLGIRL